MNGQKTIKDLIMSQFCISDTAPPEYQKSIQKCVQAGLDVVHFQAPLAHGVSTLSLVFRANDNPEPRVLILLPSVIEASGEKLAWWLESLAKKGIATILFYPHLWSHYGKTVVELSQVQRSIGLFVQRLLCSSEQAFFHNPSQKVFLLAHGSTATVTLAALAQSGIEHFFEQVFLLAPTFGTHNRFFLFKTFIHVLNGMISLKTVGISLLRKIFFLKGSRKIKNLNLSIKSCQWQNLYRFFVENFQKNRVHERIKTKLVWLIPENDSHHDSQRICTLRNEISVGSVTLQFPELSHRSICTSSKVVHSIAQLIQQCPG